VALFVSPVIAMLVLKRCGSAAQFTPITPLNTPEAKLEWI
jgi:hypothetical protein